MKPFEFLKNLKFPKIDLSKIDLSRLKRIPRGQIILWGAALLVTVGLFFFARGFTACWRLTSLPGIPLNSCGGAAESGIGTPQLSDGTQLAVDVPPTPMPEAPAVAYPQWDGGSRINILFIGLDYRDWQANEGPPRSDTMILFTIDPITRTAGMLSIPRDMWVNIPGYGYSRINTAYSSGEGNRLPGGGPGLAMKTVEQFIGVPVHYYVQVDFNTFVEMINIIDGIDIYSDERLVLDPAGTGTDHVIITCCGIRHIMGPEALAYARTRHTEGGDVDRAHRQQKVIFGIRDKVFSPEYFPQLIAQAPQLYNTFSAGIHTNMALDDALKLAVLVKDIPVESIRTGVIDYTMVTFDNVVLGGQNASIFKPIPDKIRVLRDQIFTTGGPLSPLAQGDATALMQADGARVRVLNGTYTAQLDSRTGYFLQAQGMQVTEVGNADGLYNNSVVIVYSPKLYALRYLITTFGIAGSNQIIFRPDPAQTVDLEIRLGNDWPGRLPAGY